MHLLTPQSRQPLTKALGQMTSALQILDEIGAPGEIGATLDMAIERLRQALGSGGDNGMRLLFSQLEKELARFEGGPGFPPNP